MSILSGIAGAGGGLVMTPLSIFLGMPPASAVASGKFNGIALTIGSLTELRHYHTRATKRRIIAIMLLALVIGLGVPVVIKSFDSRYYRLALGTILLIILPLLYYRRVGMRAFDPTPLQKVLGVIFLPTSFIIEGIFSSGAGVITSVVLTGLFGQTTTEAQITRRWEQITLNVAIVLSLLTSGLIFWSLAIVGAVSSLLGSMIGARLAIKEGDIFATHVLLGLTAVSAVAIIISSL